MGLFWRLDRILATANPGSTWAPKVPNLVPMPSIRPEMLLATAMIAACGASGARPLEVSSHGGAFVPLDGGSAELVVHASGELHVHASVDPRASRDVGITVTLPGEDGARHAVALRFEDETQGFVGAMRVRPTPGDAELLLVRGGHSQRLVVPVGALLPAPRHGGSVLAVGAHIVEVQVDESGEAHLHVHGADSIAAELSVVVSLAEEDGRLHPLSLSWDAGQGHHVGQIEGLVPRPGPLQVIVLEQGRERVGRGTLREVASVEPALPELDDTTFRLDVPQLGSEVPSVIVVPTPDEATD